MKILIIRFSSIGDIVITSPIVRCIRKKYPESQIHFLTKAKYSDIVKHSTHINKVIILDEENEKNTFSHLVEQDYEVVFDLHKNFRTWRIKKILKTTWFSFDKLNIQKWLFVNFKINLLPKKHLVDRYFDSIAKLGIVNDNQGLEYSFPSDFSFDLNQHNLLPKSYTAIAIGGTYHTKQIPKDVLLAIIKRLSSPIVLLGGGKSDAIKSAAIENEVQNLPVLNLVNSISLHESAFIIKNARLLITGDTGLMHIAASLSTPVHTLWGNTHPLFGMFAYKPASGSFDYQVDLPCNPCSKLGSDSCPRRHFKCMNDQNVEQIVKNCLSIDSTQ